MQQDRRFRSRKFYILTVALLFCFNMLHPLAQQASASAADDTEFHSLEWANDISDWQLDEDAGMLYVLSAAGNSLNFINVNQMTVDTSLSVGSKPNAMSRYGNILYIALSGENKIARVDLSSKSLLTPITTPGNAYYIAATSTHLLYSTEDATYKYQLSNETNTVMYMRSKTSLFADESTNRLYIGEPFGSGSNFAVLNYLTNEKLNESRSYDGNHLYYPNEKIFADENYVYYAGSKLDKNNVNRVYGTYPTSGQGLYSYAQISDVNDRFVLTHEAIFEKGTLKKVADFPYQTTRALISDQEDAVYFFNNDDHIIERYYLLQTDPEELTLTAEGLDFIQANHVITDFATNEETQYLYAISEETNDLVVMEKETRQVVNTLAVGSKPVDIELLEDNIYIAFAGENNVGMISMSKALLPDAKFERIPTLEYPYRISPDRDRLFYTGDDQHQSLRVLNKKDGTEIKYASLYFPSMFADRVNQMLYVADSQSTNSKIYSFSTANNSTSFLTSSINNVPQYVEQRYVHADGENVYYNRDRLNSSNFTVISTYPEQIIYAKDKWVFGMNAVYDRNTSSKKADLPFVAQHVYIAGDESIYIASAKRFYFFQNMNALITYAENANTTGAPLLWDEHEEAGKIKGSIYFSGAEDEGAIASYNLYFADEVGNKLGLIGNVNSQNKVNDYMYEYTINQELTVPATAVNIGVVPVIKGNFSDSGKLVLGHLWDSPNNMAREVRMTDTDARANYFAGTVTWKQALNEPANGVYRLFFTDGEELLGEAVRSVPTGSKDYEETIGAVLLPSGAIGFSIIMEDSAGNSIPSFKPAIFSEHLSASISLSDVTIVNNATGPDQITVSGVSYGDQIWVRKNGSNLLLYVSASLSAQNSLVLNIPNLGNPSDKLLLIRRSIGKYFSEPLVVTVPNTDTAGGSTPGEGTPGGGTPGGGTPGGGTPGGGTPGGGLSGGGIIIEEPSDSPWKTEATTTPDGKKVMQIQLNDNGVEELAKLDELKDSNVFQIISEDQAQRYEVSLPKESLAKMLLLDADASLRIATPQGSWKIPVTALSEGIDKASTAPVIIIIDEASKEYGERLKSQLEGSGSQTLGSLLDFSVTVAKDGTIQQHNHFTEYVEHELIIKTEQVPINQLAGLTYDPVTKKFVPVPFKAVWKDGVLRVSLFKKGNSVYTVVRTGKGSYKDVKSESMYLESIEALTARMVLKGYTDGTFKPEQSITRAEFAALLNRMLGILPSTNTLASKFADIKKGAWYEKDIIAAVSSGLILGYSPTSFKPNQTITHQEMIAMLVRAYDYVSTSPLTSTSVTIPEGLNLPEWFKPTYQQAVQQGILLSESDAFTFNPTQTANRQESAYLLNRLINVLKFG